MDGDVTCLEAPRVRLELRDIPRRGAPIVISTVELDTPTLRIVVALDGTIAGFSDMVRSTKGRTFDDGGSSRPSDVFAIRDMTVRDGVFEWTDAAGATMKLDDLDFDLKGKPDADPGWYALHAELDRAPVLELQVDGRFNLDELELDLESFAVGVTLQKEETGALPSGLQAFLTRHEVRGTLKITGTLKHEFSDPGASTLDADLRLSDAYFVAGHAEVPTDQLTLHIAIADRTARLDPIAATIFGGTLGGSASVGLTGDNDAQVKLNGKGLRIEQAVRETSSFESGVVGAVSLDATITVPLATLPAGLDGSGHIAIDEGRLMKDPVFGGVMTEGGEHPPNLHDRGKADFRLHPDHVAFRGVRFVAGLVGARGEGEMNYDGGIDLRFNVGPIERVENETGPLGELAGLLTDRVVTYELEGTWAAPRFEVHPLGIGAGRE